MATSFLFASKWGCQKEDKFNFDCKIPSCRNKVNKVGGECEEFECNTNLMTYVQSKFIYLIWKKLYKYKNGSNISNIFQK